MIQDIQIARLTIEVTRLKAENARLRKRLAETSRHADRVRQAYTDAVLLAEWAGVGIAPSLKLAKRHMVSRRRWQNAIGLLRLAGVIRHAPSYAWLLTNVAEIERRIEAVRGLAMADPDIFRGCLGSHANHEWEARR